MATNTKRGKVEGEGSYSATKGYREGLEAFVKSGKVGTAARAARKAVESTEGIALRKAERRARRRGGVTKGE
jgi:hypothetical protein